ncbi:Putative 4-hydroxybenzoyl CoA thioesterase [Vulgatibacter incomptus]|uniref:Putative 4-hydroxybenzoyl CoA thioesterase n=1 Tax=Vulgatibacter incomptus TaxID=1391653 RepID=A0A0K1PFS8_9BACT|nr:Putative 4-hydroxybenzoyl CoA thioesterase [Vulgatibacter incomptus]
MRFNEVDAAGIVFYPRFFDYFHMTFEDFFGDATGTPYPVWINEKRIGWPAVHVETDFLSPLRYGTTVELHLTFPRVKRTSFVCRYEARDPETGRTLCTSEITVVTTDLDELKPLPIPDAVRDTLERFAA